MREAGAGERWERMPATDMHGPVVWHGLSRTRQLSSRIWRARWVRQTNAIAARTGLPRLDRMRPVSITCASPRLHAPRLARMPPGSIACVRDRLHAPKLDCMRHTSCRAASPCSGSSSACPSACSAPFCGGGGGAGGGERAQALVVGAQVGARTTASTVRGLSSAGPLWPAHAPRVRERTRPGSGSDSLGFACTHLGMREADKHHLAQRGVDVGLDREDAQLEHLGERAAASEDAGGQQRESHRFRLLDPRLQHRRAVCSEEELIAFVLVVKVAVVGPHGMDLCGSIDIDVGSGSQAATAALPHYRMTAHRPRRIERAALGGFSAASGDADAAAR